MKFKRLPQVRALYKSAGATETEFFLVPKSAIKGKDANGDIILSKSAEVSDPIRKEDLEGAGYSTDQTDDQGNDGGGMTPEMAKEHAMALQKCRGDIMKAAGVTEADMMPQDGSGEGNAPGMMVDEMGKSVKVGDIIKRLEASFEQKLGAAVEAITKSAGAAGGAAPLGARKEGEGAGTLQKRDDAGTTNAGTTNAGALAEGDELKKAVTLLNSLTAERAGIIAKQEAKIPLTDQEKMRSSVLYEEISKQELRVNRLATTATA